MIFKIEWAATKLWLHGPDYERVTFEPFKGNSALYGRSWREPQNARLTKELAIHRSERSQDDIGCGHDLERIGAREKF